MQIVTPGRRDISEYFRQVVLAVGKLNHTPLLAFVVDNQRVTVDIVDKPWMIMRYPDDTQVMGQWAGQWRSDFFSFTVKELREHIAANPQHVLLDKAHWHVE